MSFCFWRRALAAGLLLGAFFFGGLWWTVTQGRFIRAAGALVLRQPAAADEHCPGGILLCRAANIGSGGCCVSSALSWRVSS